MLSNRPNHDFIKYGSGMMIDTLAIAKRLKEAGFNDAQAEVQAQIISYTVDNAVTTQAATQIQLLETEGRLDKTILETEDRLDEKLYALDKKIDGVEKRLDAKIYALDKKIDGVEKRLDAKIDAVEKMLDAKIDALRLDLVEVEKRLEAKINELRVEMHKLFNSTMYLMGGGFVTILTIIITYLEFKFK